MTEVRCTRYGKTMRPTLIDRHVAQWIETITSVRGLDSVVDMVSSPLFWAPPLALGVFYVLRRGGRRAWALVLAAALITISSQLLIGTFLGALLNRLGPDGVTQSGYLSASVLTAFALATLVGRIHPDLRLVTRVGAIGLAFIELYQMSHWFCDVFGALLLGSFIGVVVARSMGRVEAFVAAPSQPNRRRRVRNTAHPVVTGTVSRTRWPTQDPFRKR